jgi:hypothetical protein
MTDTSASALPATAPPAGLPTAPTGVPDGLEDFGAGDAVTPTISIEHAKAVFRDSLTNEEFATLDCIILGLVKQRLLWSPELPDGDAKSVPLCKAPTFVTGLPGENFPWGEFAKKGGLEPAGSEAIDCDKCPLKEWETHPSRPKVPWCSEVMTLIIMRPAGNGWAPALLSLQRSALKNVKAYLTKFRNEQIPAYTYATTIRLKAMKKGKTEFAVPEFVLGPATPPESYPFWSENFHDLREYVQTRGWGSDDDDVGTGGDAAEAEAAANAAPVQHAEGGAEEPIPF